MFHRRIGLIGSLLALLWAGGLSAQDGTAGRVRGVTISTHGNGEDWGSDAIVAAFAAAKRVGANWVAIHPYAGIGNDGAVRFRSFPPGQPPEHWVRPIREAHALGLEILVIPHIAYWGSQFSWRGEIEFQRDEDWDRFFTQYEAFLTAVATACQEADALCIGNELDRTVRFDARWRGLIAAVRQRTRAKLTYAANWTDYQRVPFWDALDTVGVQAYFPIADHPDAAEEVLRAGWKRRMEELRAYSERTGKEICFTELGYNRAFAAPVQPWAYATDGPEAEAVQARCLRIALEAVEAEPRVVGSFLWKWFPPPRPVGRNFQLATPRLCEIIAGVWQPASAPPR